MTARQISPADRIRELSEISQRTAAIIESAGLAINALTDQWTPAEAGDVTTNGHHATIGSRKQAFEKHVGDYYQNLQAVVAQLRRQTYALEEAGIISVEAPTLAASRDQRQSSSSNKPFGQDRALNQDAIEPDKITNGGLGSLDVGYLNSRGNKVGAEKEAELMAEAKDLLEILTPNRDQDAMRD